MPNSDPCLAVVFQVSLVIEEEFWRRVSGEGRPYLRQRSWTWFDQVVELLLHILSMYSTMLYTVELGLLQMLWSRPSVRMWRTPSIGSSPRRKKRAGVGEEDQIAEQEGCMFSR